MAAKNMGYRVGHIPYFCWNVGFEFALGHFVFIPPNILEYHLSVSKKPQITINAYNISSHREQISMAWDNIASFEFRNYKGNVSLILVYRPTSSDERLQPENPQSQSSWQNLKNYFKTHLVQQNAYLSLDNLAIDEKKLSKLFTQLIATQDPAQREIWIHQFQAA